MLPAQEFPADKSRIAEAVRADLSKLSDLERSYFAANKRYTVDIKALHFVPVSGATIAVSYASARTFSASAPASRGAARPPAAVSATPVTVGGTEPSAAKPTGPSAGPVTLTASEVAERLRAVAGAKGDSVIVIVQFAVKDARYDPSRGVLEVAVERVPMPLAGLTYIARDLLRVPRSRAPDPELLRSGLTLQARFAIGRRDDTPGPALTLLALLLQSKGEVVSRWEAAVIH